MQEISGDLDLKKTPFLSSPKKSQTLTVWQVKHLTPPPPTPGRCSGQLGAAPSSLAQSGS